MTQHTDMGWLVERLRLEADLVWEANERAADVMREAADAIEALSIPQGLGEDEVERAARAIADADVDASIIPFENLIRSIQDDYRRMARAALTSARAQGVRK